MPVLAHASNTRRAAKKPTPFPFLYESEGAFSAKKKRTLGAPLPLAA